MCLIAIGNGVADVQNDGCNHVLHLCIWYCLEMGRSVWLAHIVGIWIGVPWVYYEFGDLSECLITQPVLNEMSLHYVAILVLILVMNSSKVIFESLVSHLLWNGSDTNIPWQHPICIWICNVETSALEGLLGDLVRIHLHVCWVKYIHHCISLLLYTSLHDLSLDFTWNCLHWQNTRNVLDYPCAEHQSPHCSAPFFVTKKVKLIFDHFLTTEIQKHAFKAEISRTRLTR